MVEGLLPQVYFRHVNIRWFLGCSIVSVSSVYGVSAGAEGPVQVYKSDSRGRVRHVFARGRVLHPDLPRMPSCGFEAQHNFRYLDTVVDGAVFSLRERALLFQGSMLVSVDSKVGIG